MTTAGSPASFATGQTLTVSGATVNQTTFTVSYGTVATGSITYTGTAADATAIQTGLNNALATAGIIGSVTVLQTSPGVFLVLSTASSTSISAVSPYTQTVTLPYALPAIAWSTNGATDVQTIMINSPVANVTQFNLNFNGVNTPFITYTGVTATDIANVQGALNALTTVTPVGGTATVAEPSPGVFTVTLGGTLNGPGQPQITGVVLNPGPGVTQFTLSFEGATTAPITYTGLSAIDASAVQQALNGLSTIGGSGGLTTVTEPSPGVFAITLSASLSGAGQPPVTAAISNPQIVGGTVSNPSIAGTTNAVTGVQTITLTNPLANQTQFNLTFNGATTAPITYTGVTVTDIGNVQAR